MLAESAMGWAWRAVLAWRAALAWRAVLGEQASKYEVRVVLPPLPAPWRSEPHTVPSPGLVDPVH